MKQVFAVTVRVLDSPQSRSVTEVHEFDSDDIYDAALASVVRSIARRAQVSSGVRESADLA